MIKGRGEVRETGGQEHTSSEVTCLTSCMSSATARLMRWEWSL